MVKIIQFQQLDEAAILKIVDLELSKLHKRIFDMKYALRVSDAAKKFIAKKGYDVQFGARPLRRAIENYIEDDVADLLVNNNLPEWSVIFADYNEGDERLTIKVENEKSKDEQDASARQTNLNWFKSINTKYHAKKHCFVCIKNTDVISLHQQKEIKVKIVYKKG